MKKFGLIGEKLSHSLSPQIHNIIKEEMDLDFNYELLEINSYEIPEMIDEYDGLNVTIPYKEEVMQYLKSISPEVNDILAVNTIYKNTGYNTDYFGFGKMLNLYDIDLKDKVIVILGTGGASKAVSTYINNHGCRNYFYISRSKKGDKILNYDELGKINADIIINTTPVGMFPDVEKSPVDKEILKNFNTAIDLIYNPDETLFLKYAKEFGLKTVNGMYMLIAQAVKAQEIWNQRSFNNKLINQIYKKLVIR